MSILSEAGIDNISEEMVVKAWNAIPNTVLAPHIKDRATELLLADDIDAFCRLANEHPACYRMLSSFFAGSDEVLRNASRAIAKMFADQLMAQASAPVADDIEPKVIAAIMAGDAVTFFECAIPHPQVWAIVAKLWKTGTEEEKECAKFIFAVMKGIGGPDILAVEEQRLAAEAKE